MAEKKKTIHLGHRDRMKQEFLDRGMDGWPDHRVLELLLFYAIPQGDVNPLAHELIDRFGSLNGVLDALPGALEQVPGVGKHTTAFLKLLPAVLGRYAAERTGPGDLIQTVEDAGRVLIPYFSGARNEMVYILCLDSKEKLLAVKKLSEGNLNSSEVTIRRAAEECVALQATYCYLAHNHVSGIALPSPADMNATDVVQAALSPLGVRIVDHLVFAEGEIVSLRQSRDAGVRVGFCMVGPETW